MDGAAHGTTAVSTLPRSTSEIANWLAGQDPSKTNKAAVSLASSHGVELEVKYEHRFPSGPNGERLPSYVVAVGCEVAPGGDRAAAIADIQKLLVPADTRIIEEWLAELSVITARRRSGEFEDELRLVAYTSRLGEYPADVVRHALLKRRWRFWPSWDELASVCDQLASPRNHMLNSLRKKQDDQPSEPPATDEQRASILKEFGFAPRRFP